MLLCCRLQYDGALLQRAGAASLPARREKAERIRSVRGRAASLAAGLLLRHGLFLCGLGEDQIRTGPEGKPFLAGNPAFVSLSHSGDYAACAIAPVPVGVDIQRIQTPPRHLARLTGLEEPELFFESWVQWEARAKRTGTGILDMVRHRPPLAPGEVCTAIAAFPGYAAAAAGAETVLPEQVRRLTGADLLGRLDIWA